MKYLSLIFIALLFASCDHSQGYIEFKGVAKGINFGTIVIRDQANNNLFTTNIEGGKFSISKRFLQYSGYYKLIYSSKSGAARKLDIYLEPGAYNINIDQDKINNYPIITSTSKMQDQLSAYYAISDSVINDGRKKVVAIHGQLKDLEEKALTLDEKVGMATKLQAEQQKANQVDDTNIFNIFMTRYPDNAVAAHIMLQMDYQADPVASYKLFEKFNDAAKNSDDGKELESKLKPLAKQFSSTSAPAIAGITPDGKSIVIKSLGKKIILLDFWRSTNGTSRDTHGEMLKSLLPKFGDKGFGILSVSFDTDKNRWTTAIAGDKMTWPQLSDLKGDDSPNGETWGIKSIPTYFLLDGEGRVIEHVKDFNDVDASVGKYLKNH